MCMDERVSGSLSERGGSKLPTGITVNAGGIDEELARDVFRDTCVEVGLADLSLGLNDEPCPVTVYNQSMVVVWGAG